LREPILKNIYINARFLGRHVTGVERYATEFVKALDAMMCRGEIDTTRFSFVLLAPKNIQPELKLKYIQIRYVGYFSGHLWEQFELPFYTRGTLLINLCNTASLLKHNQIVTIHDAVVFGSPQAYSFIFRLWYKFLWKSLGVVAKTIITVSSFSEKELSKYCVRNAGKLRVIYEGKEHIFALKSDNSILEKHGLKDKPFVLAVSSLNPNKNFRSIVQAVTFLSNVNFEVVIAGGANPKIFCQSTIPLPSNVRYLGYVSDGELRSLYEHASCFVYPSFYEGFGLPPLEAMACGCPVIVSQAASLPEVCGDAALYCDPNSSKDIAEKIVLLMNNPTLREDLRRKSLERAKLFSWEKCARETFAVIKKALF